MFTKSRVSQVNTSNAHDDKMRKADDLYTKYALFGTKDAKYAADSKEICPINNVELERKERQKQVAMDSGKAWGSMPKVELTEEIKNDLKAIQFRN